MRAAALEGARLDAPDLEVLDAGAGTGFTTEGIVERVAPAGVTMLDQSPTSSPAPSASPRWRGCAKLLGDAEELPFATDRFDRYVSAGSVVLARAPAGGGGGLPRPAAGGTALIVGPVGPPTPCVRRLSSVWMLFPEEHEYRDWYERAGFADVEIRHLAPDWYRARDDAPYALAIAGRKPARGRLAARAAGQGGGPRRAAEPAGAHALRRALRGGLARRRGVRPARARARAARAGWPRRAPGPEWRAAARSGTATGRPAAPRRARWASCGASRARTPSSGRRSASSGST